MGCQGNPGHPDCGPGTQTQTRECTDGTIDLCTAEDTTRVVSCAIAKTALPACKASTCEETIDPTSRFYVDDGCHTEKGSKKNKQDDYAATYELPSFKAGVRCCSTNGTTCDTFGTCPGQSTYCDAVNECEAKNMRVCTKDELLSEICCNTGGNCDNHPVWTSTLEPDNSTTTTTATSTDTTSTNTTSTDTTTSTSTDTVAGCKSDTWPDVKKGKICDDCLALIKIKSYGTCGKYCKSLGLTCVSAYEEVSNTCTIESTFGCDTKVLGSDGKVTSDALCKCTADTGSTASTNTTTTMGGHSTTTAAKGSTMDTTATTAVDAGAKTTAATDTTTTMGGHSGGAYGRSISEEGLETI